MRTCAGSVISSASRSGAAQTTYLQLRLPHPSGTVRIALDGGSSEGRIVRPAGVPVALSARGGVSRLRFDDQKRESSGADLRISSPSYAKAPDRYELDLAGGVSRLVIGGVMSGPRSTPLCVLTRRQCPTTRAACSSH